MRRPKLCIAEPIKAFYETENEILRKIDSRKADIITVQHRLHRLIGYCCYPMKMTMNKSYFECYTLLRRD